MSGKKDTPRRTQTGVKPTGCMHCRAPFSEGWLRSTWTDSGYSPWCPACHAKFQPPKAHHGSKPGPKPKGWTNMPIN